MCSCDTCGNTLAVTAPLCKPIRGFKSAVSSRSWSINVPWSVATPNLSASLAPAIGFSARNFDGQIKHVHNGASQYKKEAVVLMQENDDKRDEQ